MTTTRQSDFREAAGIAMLLLAVPLACSRCRPGQPHLGDPASLVPREVDAAVYVPDVQRLATRAAGLSKLELANLAASLTGAPDAAALLRDVNRQLGFDPTQADQLAAAGLQPHGPLIVALMPDGTELLIASAADENKLSATLARLVRAFVGPVTRAEDRGVVSLALPASIPVLAYAFHGGLLALASGPRAKTLAQQALSLAPPQSLADDPAYASIAKRSADRTLAAYFPQGSPHAQAMGLSRGGSASLDIEPKRISLMADVPLGAAQATLLASLRGNAGSDLLADLDPDAFLFARTALDPATLWPLTDAVLPAPLRQRLLNAGVRANDDILQNLQPGAALSLALAPGAQLASMPSLDPSQSNPFRFLLLAGLGRAKDPAKAAATLAQMKKLAPALEAQVEERAVGQDEVYVFRYALGEGASIALDGKTVVLSGGEGRMAPLLARLHAAGAAAAALDPERVQRLSIPGAAAYLDVSQLAKSVRALPPSAYGLGGFAIRAAVGRWLDALDEVRSLTLLADDATSPDGATLRLELVVMLR